MTPDERCAILIHHPFAMTDTLILHIDGNFYKYIVKNNMENLAQELTNWSLVEQIEKIYVISDFPFAEELMKNLKIDIKVEDI